VAAERGHGRAAAALAAFLTVLLVAGAAALVRTGGDPPSDPVTTAVTPPPSPDPTATPTATPTPTPTPTRTPPATPVPGIDELLAQVSAIRGLEATRPLQSGAVSERELADIFSEIAFEELDPLEIEADERLLVALRLVPAGTDLLAVVEALYREQVVGLYVPRDEILYVRSAGGDLSPFERYTAVHEVVHALQDQRFGLEELRDLPDEHSDEALALLALIEGDAVLTQQLWSFAHQSDDDRGRLRAESLGIGGEALARSPRYIREALTFPYREGATFVQALYERGGFAAVDDAFAEPPSSTAQIYHPQRYFDGLAPVAVALPDTPGGGWEGPRTYSFGEFDLRELMAPLGSQTATTVGTGWAGGEVRAWQRDAATAVAVGFAFDTQQDADEACEAMPRWFSAVADATHTEPGLMSGDGDWMAWTCTALEVRFAVAPDGRLAQELAQHD
jgi:hypothetical protein